MTEKTSPDKLSLIIQSEDPGRVHYALALASAALAIGKPVTLFFTMEGTKALTPGWVDRDREAELAAAKLATFEDLLSACVELDGRFMVCEMGLRAAGLAPGMLREDVPITEGSAVSFLADASRNGAMLYV